MKQGLMVRAVILVQLSIFCAGCGDINWLTPHHNYGVYVDRIWTEPEHVTAGALVELHMHEVINLAPGFTLPPTPSPPRWSVSAGDFFNHLPSTEELPPLAERPMVTKIPGMPDVWWLAPDEPRPVQVAVYQSGDPLSVTITVHPAET